MHGDSLEFHFSGLPSHFMKGTYRNTDTPNPYYDQQEAGQILRGKETNEIVWRVCGGVIALYGGGFLLYYAIDKRGWRKWILGTICMVLIAAGLGAFLLPVYWQPYCEQNPYCQNLPHNLVIVPQKHLTSHSYWGTVIT
jgi:hypothetical protein